ncbi:membrane protein involved in colicin uptake [Spongiibacter sp. IMCC21906]|uniref:VWA domain-containing protein n=1 Tax=Spongiibacter sp. IMCC21906 TaxID=1620392 RepID=UPI00062DE554|nr:VWA domain-containing protein [Spongiibacter sp. IMCC21906]AKH68739.1 membrane protein involved in colicin uptake [Spongiibacter sp. IMCC21906]
MPDLHFLRPEMLWAAPLLILTVILLMRGRWQGQRWQKYIDPTLLPYLLQNEVHTKPRRRLLSLMTAALLLQLALLGPSWQQAPVALYKNQQALAIILDMSPSMLAEDIKPSRFKQAKFKLRDILQLREDGQTGLVVFSGDAFVVAPLTDDSNTLLTLLPGLYPGMMPVIGSNPKAAMQKAIELLDNGRGSNGQILLISDGVEDQQMDGIKSLLADTPYPVSVLAVGSKDGAPIPLSDGGFARNNDGSIIVPKLKEANLRKLASSSGGLYRSLSLDNSDIESLNAVASQVDKGEQHSLDRRFDQWQDAGHWLVLLCLPLALLCFRRSWMPTLLLAGLLGSHSNPSYALSWGELWTTPDQRGAALMESAPAEAAKAFKDPMWQGAANYRAGNYAAAAEAFGQSDTADAHYNRGNALANAGDLDGAIAAYDKALEKQPKMTDAHANRQLIQELKEQQEKQQQQQQGGDDQQNSDSQDKQQQNQNQQDQNKQNEKQQEQNQDQQNQQDNGQSKQNQKQDGQPSDKQGQNGDQAKDQQSGQNQEQEQNDQAGKDDAQQQAQQQKEQRQAQAAKDHAQQGQPEQQAASSNDDKEPPQAQAAQGRAATQEDQQLSEDQQAREQWLRKIPDNPAGLLERKFRYQSQQRSNRQDLSEDDAYAPY